MKIYKFEGIETELLKITLLRPIISISIIRGVASKISRIVIWNDKCVGVSVRSKMHDVSERFEIGSLCFDYLSRESFDGSGCENYKLNNFSHPKNIDIMKYKTGEVCSESGLSIKNLNGDEILIVSGAYPYTIDFYCLELNFVVFEPEFGIEYYERSPLI